MVNVNIVHVILSKNVCTGLRQARNATRKQLRQVQLATRRQLALAQATYDAQMKESKYSIFSNVFYVLLNQKHSRYLSL